MKYEITTCGVCYGDGCKSCENTGSKYKVHVGYLLQRWLTKSQKEYFEGTGKCPKCIKCYEIVKEKSCPLLVTV